MRIVQFSFPGGAGRWELRRSSFREGGVSHQLLVLSDLSRALRVEERQAWQRLVRVLGHEVNNSLAPIKSIAGSLESLLEREPRPGDCHGLTQDCIVPGKGHSHLFRLLLPQAGAALDIGEQKAVCIRGLVWINGSHTYKSFKRA